jgi:dihydrodipicolinate synthase/N-acetylneuraminate lyase
MPVDLLLKIADLKEIKIVKETSRNVKKMARVINELRDKVDVFTVFDVFMDTLLLGGKGIVGPPPIA